MAEKAKNKSDDGPTINQIELTLQELVDSEASFDYLGDRKLSGKLVYRIGRLRRTLKPFFESYADARNSLVEKYGQPDKNGNPLVRFKSKGFKPFEKARKELLKEKVNFESIELTLAELEAPETDNGEAVEPWLTAKILGDLYWLIKE